MLVNALGNSYLKYFKYRFCFFTVFFTIFIVELWEQIVGEEFKLPPPNCSGASLKLSRFIYLSSAMSQSLRNHIEAISPLTDEEFAYILSHYKVRHLKKHAYLLQEDDYAHYEYYVVKGCLKSFIIDPKTGKEFIYEFCIEDWWATDREAFYQSSKSTINISCLEDCELLGITLADREKLGQELWKYEHFMRVKISLGYISLKKRIQMMIMGSAKERYEQFTRQYPHFINRIPKTYIASYLGVSRETLSRLYHSSGKSSAKNPSL